MPEKRREKVSRYELITGQDSYASQTSQNPETSRRLFGLVPQPNGILQRQNGITKFYPVSGNQPITNLIPFIYNNAGVFERHLFAKFQGIGALEENATGLAWNAVSTPFSFANPPIFASEHLMASVIGGNLHIVDGINNYLYDGGTKEVVNDGFPIPLFAPADSIAPVSGNPVILVNRYYWTTWSDHTLSREHESSVSPISAGTGMVTNQQIEVFQAQGTITGAFNTTLVTGTNTLFSTLTATFANIGYAHLYIDGFDLGPIASITDDTHLVLLNPITVPAGFGNIAYVVAPSRATHWHLYASESETSKVGLLLYELSLPVTRNGTITVNNGQSFANASQATFYTSDIGGHLVSNGVSIGIIADIVGPEPSTGAGLVSAYTGATLTAQPYSVSQITAFDNSDWFGTPESMFQQINRPVRNDPPVVSSLLAEHKYRLFRRRDTRPNFFSFSANEEVTATNNGSPYESNPGVDPNTESDIVNEDSYPDQSNEIRAMVSHADALYILTEIQTIPLFGETIDDFALSQVTAFNVGCAGSFAAISTPHGLVFMSNDRKVYLYPTSNYPWTYIPTDVNVTEQLLEIGLPLRTVFSTIPITNLNNVRMTFYNYMTRDWLVLSFTDDSNTVHNWVYDFVTKGWFEITPAYVSVVIYEFATGEKVLLGGGTDGYVYVMDDLTGSFPLLPPFPGTPVNPAPVLTVTQQFTSGSALNGNFYVKFSEFVNGVESFISTETGPYAVNSVFCQNFVLTPTDPNASKYRMYFGTTPGQENAYYEAVPSGNTVSFLLYAPGTAFTGNVPQLNVSPAGTFRPALIDFGDPDSKHVFRYIEFELTNPNMIGDITVNYWLDPADVDNPGPSQTLVMAQVRGANLFRGFPKNGGLCQRLLVSLDFVSSTNIGGIRGIKLVADNASSLIY